MNITDIEFPESLEGEVQIAIEGGQLRLKVFPALYPSGTCYVAEIFDDLGYFVETVDMSDVHADFDHDYEIFRKGVLFYLLGRAPLESAIAQEIRESAQRLTESADLAGISAGVASALPDVDNALVERILADALDRMAAA